MYALFQYLIWLAHHESQPFILCDLLFLVSVSSPGLCAALLSVLRPVRSLRPPRLSVWSGREERSTGGLFLGTEIRGNNSSRSFFHSNSKVQQKFLSCLRFEYSVVVFRAKFPTQSSAEVLKLPTFRLQCCSLLQGEVSNPKFSRSMA